MDIHANSQTKSGATEPLAAQWLQRPMWVVLQRGDVKLPGAVGLSSRKLSYEELCLLQTLARGEPVDSTNPLQVYPHESSLISDLVEQGLIGGELSSHWSMKSDLAAHVTLERTTAKVEEPIIVGLDMVLISPVLLKLSPRGFEHLDHEGRVVMCLQARELQAASVFGQPKKLGGARAAQRKVLGEDALTDAQFDALVTRLRISRLLCVPEVENKDILFKSRSDRAVERGWRELLLRNESTDRILADERAREIERVKAGSSVRVPIIPVSPQAFPLLSLGTVLAAARVYKDGSLEKHFQILPDWANRTLPNLKADDPPSIFLYSNYIWTSQQNHDHSDKVKEISPNSLTIHGGPDVPKYAIDVDAYFAANTSLDIVVIGEGEATFPELLEALIGIVGDEPPDLSCLRDVAGIAFRDGERVVRTADRERISDVDAIPSPFLTGLFDSCGDAGLPIGVIETNRGCPYGCTFCDWGSATLSRIRKFSLDRVFAELEWCARHRANAIYLADANFGIFPRDVQIAEKVVELKERYGFPKVLETNYAKNSVKYLGQIVKTLSAGGILTTGLLSLQSMDKNTLETIRRSNIKLEQYENLAREFRNEGLPLNVDIMMGLPGATKESFLEDLQQCVDREVRARVFPTQLLVNSPMNDPEYRQDNQVVTSNPISASWGKEGRKGYKPALVVSTASFTRMDYDEMTRMRLLFILLENFGILRLTSRFVHQASGMRELEFYIGLFDAVRLNPGRWPTVTFVLESLPDMLLPPGSWRHFIDEVHNYLVEALGIDDDSALEVMMTTQHGLLPARDRVFPQHLELQHDVAAWHKSIFLAKDEGHIVDWPSVVPPLREFGPASFCVDDPQRICELGFGSPLSYDIDSDWELGSPVARPMSKRQEHL